MPRLKTDQEFDYEWDQLNAQVSDMSKNVIFIRQKVIDANLILDSLKTDTMHLAKLDIIAEQLVNMNNNLVAPATSENRISIQVHLWTVLSLTFSILILSVFILFLLVKDSNKKINAGGLNGVTISRDTEND